MEKRSPIILGYWKSRCLGEPIRLLMEYLGVNYRNEVYELGPPPDFSRADWLKAKFSLGLDFPNLPYLIDSPIKITESIAILRYLCHKFEPRLLGSRLEEIALVDMMTGVLYDLIRRKCEYMHADDPEKLPKGSLKKMMEMVGKLAKLLEGRKYLIGDKLTLVDFLCMETLESINDLVEPIFEKHESLKRYFEDMTAIPNIEKYRKSEKFLKDPLAYNNKTARVGTTPIVK
eukprot:TRINITY_DN8459_c0_g1_i11.p1 TRINITY_DN8459_c0_g1~~TRINITY_DN8459_c0_g1_i11.p1  ORF type:complete len:231 (-),score=87.72 TRINITY_DN8459_c0_g1_i11:144-836(-)